MIVVDVNVVAYLYLPGPFTQSAENLLLRDADWAVPRLWRSEFRNILATYLRQGLLSLDQAIDMFKSAQDLLADNEFEVSAFGKLGMGAAGRNRADLDVADAIVARDAVQLNDRH